MSLYDFPVSKFKLGSNGVIKNTSAWDLPDSSDVLWFKLKTNRS